MKIIRLFLEGGLPEGGKLGYRRYGVFDYKVKMRNRNIYSASARKIVLFSFMAFAAGMVFADGNIDPTNKYAWAENAGWHNYAPTHGGVTVHPNGANGYLAGYVWAESIGWIKLGAGTGPYANTAANNYGVNLDAAGNLSGYAWSEIGGWINFHPTDSQVTINLTTGSFDGYAWSEFSGWIHFKNDSPAYNVCMIMEPTANGWLAIQVTPAGGTWQLTTPAGYTGPTSGTGNLTAVSAVTGGYDIAYGALAGYVAPSNQSQFVTGGSTSIFTGVYLQISTNIGTPTGVSATEGTYTNKIRVIWQGVAGATGYEIWRSQTNDPTTAAWIASIAADAALVSAEQANIEHPTSNIEHRTDQSLRSTLYAPLAWAKRSGGAWRSTSTYDDYAIVPIYSYYYWVRAKTATLISPMSYVGMGYAALDPEEATGTADIAVSDLVFLPVNVTNLSCAGTVSCRLANIGPDALAASGVAFDFQMGSSASAFVWIGSAQSNMTLSAGGEELIILTPSAKRGLTVRGDLNGVQQVKVVVRHLSALNDPNLANNTTTAAGSVRIKTSGVNSPARSLNDYDGDGKADVAIWHAGINLWAMCLSGQRYSPIIELYAGNIGDLTVPGDYDGDGLTDIAIYCHLNGWWNVLLSSNEQIEKEYFIGGPAFTAAQCDFDGDSKTDPMVYREADGYWLGQASSRQYAQCDTSLGETGYQSVVADYDGDGLADPAVYNRTTGLWAISLSGRGYQPLVTGTFGGSGYLPATADYDGDGLADPAIYAPGTAHWQVLMSASLATQGGYTWCDGFLGTIAGGPVPADYDGDGLADPAVYHQDTPSTGSGQAGLWELFLSTQGYQLTWGLFGGPEYQPVTE